MFDDCEVIKEIVSTVQNLLCRKKRKKKEKKEEQFSESVHCYCPTPPIGRRRPKNFINETDIYDLIREKYKNKNF